MSIKLAEYIADVLVAHGVSQNFTVTGGGAMHLNDAFGHKAGLHTVYNHNEQGCAVAAEAYARIAGKPALCCVTSGPGGTNAITGVIGGWLDSIPMLVISGQVKRETTLWSVPDLHLRQLGDQEFDIINSVGNMTKYCAMVTEPDDIAYHLEKALYLCAVGRPGPVWLDIPLDVQGAQIDPDTLRHFDPAECATAQTPPAVTDETARAVLAKLQSAKAPLVLAGTAIHHGKAEAELLELVKKLNIPVVTAWDANDTVAFDNPCFAGMPGTVGTRGGNFCVQNCDVLLSLGCRLNIRMISYNKLAFAENAYKIIVDIDGEELKKPTIHPDMPIHAEVKDFIGALLRQPYERPAAHDKWLRWAQDSNARYPAVRPEYHREADNTEVNVNPYVFIDMLFARLTAEDIIACGNGSACVVTFQAGKIKQGQRMFTNSGCAAMGYGLPAALGAAVAAPGKRVVCVDGDGSFMMNLQELQTIAHHKLSVKLMLMNNNGYHSIRQTQNNLFKPPLVGVSAESGVSFPNFAKLADAFGVPYYRVQKETDTAALEAALSAEGPVFCEVIVDETQNFEPKLSSKVLPDGKIVSPPLDDMFPFLPKEEYEANRYKA